MKRWSEHSTHMYDAIRTIPIVILLSIVQFSMAYANTAQAIPYHFSINDRQFDSIADIILKNEFLRKKPQYDKNHIELLKQIASKHNNPVLRARATFWDIRSRQLDDAPESCIPVLEKARGSITRENDYDYACLTYLLAGYNNRIGNYFMTYQLLNDAIPIFSSHNDDYFLGNSHLLMGQNYLNIGEPHEAMEQIKLAEKHYRACGYPTNRIFFFEALNAKDDDESLNLLKKSTEEGEDDPGMTIQAYGHIASIFISRNQPDSAMRYINLGKTMIEAIDHENTPLRVILNIKEAQAYMLSADYDKALRLLEDTEKANRRYPNEYYESELLGLMAQAYEAKGNKEKAYSYLKHYIEALHKFIRQTGSDEISKAKARDAINKQKNLIVKMEQDNRNAHNRFVILLLIFLTVIAASAGVLIYIIQKIKIKKTENRELRTNLEKELIIKRLNTENFERDIKQKDCEISSSVLLLSNKNDVLQQIGEITKKFSDEGRIPEEYVRQVNMLVSESIKGDDEWTRFKIHFDSVHPDFFKKLKATSLDLTENELRLCAYLRIGMRAKDIATMLSVSPASVNTNRYRIRKKLGLSKEDSLDDFIRKI